MLNPNDWSQNKEMQAKREKANSTSFDDLRLTKYLNNEAFYAE